MRGKVFMPYDNNCHLWPNTEDSFFRNIKIQPIHQKGPHCVSTVLAMLSGSEPEDFQGVVNTQDPVSWSEALQKFGMKLAYCPTDARKLKYYMTELLELNDLFTISYYTTTDRDMILGDPSSDGWVCGSHIVIMHKDKIFDPQYGRVADAASHISNGYHTKRIFRVVPVAVTRGL
jgi:hypothetical protein